MTHTQELQEKYWRKFNAYLKEHKSQLKSKQKVLSQQWHTVLLGKGWVQIELIANKKANRVELYLKGPKAKRRYALLEKRYKVDSVSKFGDDIEWKEMPGHIISKVVFENSANIENEKEWRAQFQWLMEKATMIQDFFRSKLDEVQKDDV